MSVKCGRGGYFMSIGNEDIDLLSSIGCECGDTKMVACAGIGSWT